MTIIDILRKKNHGGELTAAEIDFFVAGLTTGAVTDYQAAALVTAIYINKMSRRETVDLTLAMARSGDVLDLSGIAGIKVDKHSTGGVGDKTTLVVGPMVAALGAPVAKMSGRALGFGGGTIDKLESIHGFTTSLSLERFVDTVNQAGMVVCAQTGNLAPADKVLYALRDVTATVDDPSLIASSVMSKKIAGGADAIVLDVKAGDGAYMKTVDEARTLAEAMVRIGEGVGRKTVAVITSMDQPLGRAVGNALEVQEAMAALRGEGPADLMEVAYALASRMAVLAGKAASLDKAAALLREAVASGRALAAFERFVAAQDGDLARGFPAASRVEAVPSPASGVVRRIGAEGIGRVSMFLGAGRERKEDAIDYAAGVVLNKKVGERVERGEPLAWLHTNAPERLPEAAARATACFEVGDAAPAARGLVLGTVG